jgi:hypothetical protein
MKSKSSSESNSDLKARVNWTAVGMLHTGKFTFTVDEKIKKKKKKKKKKLLKKFLGEKILTKTSRFFFETSQHTKNRPRPSSKATIK